MVGDLQKFKEKRTIIIEYLSQREG